MSPPWLAAADREALGLLGQDVAPAVLCAVLACRGYLLLLGSLSDGAVSRHFF